MNKNDAFRELIVVKRSGQRVSFNSNKIAVAIKNAFDQVIPVNNEKKVNKVYEEVLEFINKNYSERKTINVEDIQDIIEKKIQENGFKEVYISFSEYRSRRAASRNVFGPKNQHKFAKAIERITNENVLKKYEDAYSNDILLDFGKTISCEYAKAYILDSKLVRAHEEGSIYIHNLDYFWLGKLSSTNLVIKESVLDNFPINLINMLLFCKTEIDGEISVKSLDALLRKNTLNLFKEKLNDLLLKYLSVTEFVEYINIKKLEDKIEKIDTLNFELDIFEQFILNKKVESIFLQAIHDTTNFVAEFFETSFKSLLISLNENCCENKKFSFTIGGINNFEEIFIDEIILKVVSELQPLKNVTLIFAIYNETSSTILNKIGELILDKKNIALVNLDSSFNKNELEIPTYFSDGKRIFENPIYGVCGSDGRMLVASISINMSRLGLKCADKSIDEFYAHFKELLELSKNGLISIFEVLGDKFKKNYRAIFNNNIIDDDKLEYDQKIRKILKKGVLNIELAGLMECVLSLEVEEEQERKELLKDIIIFAQNICQEYTRDFKLNFVLSETSKSRPLRKLMELDKAINGIRKGITDKTSYNRIDGMFSFKKNIEEDFEFMKDYQSYLDGGNLFLIEISKNSRLKYVLDIIELAKKSGLGFLKIKVGD